MGINQRYAIDEQKSKQYGQHVKTIDFEFNENYSKESYDQKSKRFSCGTFLIGGKEFNLTIHEMEYIKDTMERALEVLHKKRQLGKLA